MAGAAFELSPVIPLSRFRVPLSGPLLLGSASGSKPCALRDGVTLLCRLPPEGFPQQSVPCLGVGPTAPGRPKRRGTEKETQNAILQESQYAHRLSRQRRRDSLHAQRIAFTPGFSLAGDQRELKDKDLAGIQDPASGIGSCLGKLLNGPIFLRRAPSSKPRAKPGTASFSPMGPTLHRRRDPRHFDPDARPRRKDRARR